MSGQSPWKWMLGAFALLLSVVAWSPEAEAQICGLPGFPDCGDAGSTGRLPYPINCGLPGEPACECNAPGTPDCTFPTCGVPGTPSCPSVGPECGVPGTPECSTGCGGPGQPLCYPVRCGVPGAPDCLSPPGSQCPLDSYSASICPLPTCGLPGLPECQVCGDLGAGSSQCVAFPGCAWSLTLCSAVHGYVEACPTLLFNNGYCAPISCGGPGQPECTIPSCGVPDRPSCGEPPSCGVPGTPDCEAPPTCGVPGTPDCEALPTCGLPGLPPCGPLPTCGVPGTPSCEALPPCGVPGTPDCGDHPYCGAPGQAGCQVDSACITPADPACRLSLRWHVDAAQVAEGNGEGDPNRLEFRVRNSGVSGVATTLIVRTETHGEYPAMPGVDYPSIPSAEVRVAADESSATVSIPVSGNTTYEPDKTLGLRLLEAQAVDPLFGTARTVIDGTGPVADMTAILLGADGFPDLLSFRGNALVSQLNDGQGAFTPGQSLNFPGDTVRGLSLYPSGSAYPLLLMTAPSLLRMLAVDGSSVRVQSDPRSQLPIGQVLRMTRIADLDRDGFPDLVVIDDEPGIGGVPQVRVLLHRGIEQVRAGAFSSFFFPAVQVTLDTGGGTDHIADLAFVDLTGDGRPELIAALGGSSPALLVLRNQGDGQFDAVPLAVFALARQPLTLRAADLDGDGRADLALSLREEGAPGATGTVKVLLYRDDPEANCSVLWCATPGRGFSPRDYAVGRNPVDMIAFDVDEDGQLDLVTANADSNDVSVLRNLEVGQFGDARSFPAGEGPRRVFAGPFQPGDRLPDLIVLNTQTGTVTLLPGAPRQEIVTPFAVGTILNDDSPDTQPDPFSFDPATGVAPGSLQQSGTVTIQGIEAPALVTVTGGAYRVITAAIAGGFTTAPGTVIAGQQLQVRHTASLLFDTTTETIVTVGGQSASFLSTTVVRDTTPDPFAFAPQTGVMPGATVLSQPITVTGINSGTPISSSGGVFCINARPCGSGTVVNNGDQVRVRLTAADFGQTTTATLWIGGVSGDFVVTTLTGVPGVDTVPDGFDLGQRSRVGLAQWIGSRPITVSGIDAPALVRVSGGEYRIRNDGGWSPWQTAPGEVLSGQQLQVRHFSASLPLTATETRLDIGGRSGRFVSITTRGGDARPQAFALPTVIGVAPGVEQRSPPIVVRGTSTASSIQIEGGEYRIFDGTAWGAWTSEGGFCEPGDRIQVRHVSASAPLSQITTRLNIGGVIRTFTTVTTTASDGTPFALAFMPRLGVEPSTEQRSQAVLINGMSVARPVRIQGGEYRIREGETWGGWTSADGIVAPGNRIQVRHISAANPSTSTHTELAVGRVSARFTSTTAAISDRR